MSTQELRLRYFIQLASNIGATSKREAQEYERAQQRITQSTRLADRSVKDFDRSIDQLASNSTLERQIGYFNRLAASIDRARSRASQLKDVVTSVAAGGVAGLYAANQITQAPMAFDFRLRQAALTAFGERGVAETMRGTSALRNTVNSAVRQYGGSREQALSGYQFLIGTGAFNADEAERLLPIVQEVAVGTATDVERLSSLSMRLKTIMGIQFGAMRKTLSKMARVGQLGGVEIDQQAGYIADLAGEYGAIGYTGERGAVAASVDLQLAFKAAGSADSARTILGNFYGKILSADTARDFAKIKGKDGKGVDLYAEIARRSARGMDGVEAFMSLVDEVLAAGGADERVKQVLSGVRIGDPSQMENASRSVSSIFERAGLGTFLQDKEAMRGFLSLYKQRDERQRMIGVAMSDTGQTLDTISRVIQDSPEVQKQKAMAEAAIAAEAAFQAVVEPVNGLMHGAASLAQEFPKMAAALAGLTGAATVSAAAIGAMGLSSLVFRGGGGAAAAGVGAGVAAGATGLMSRLAGSGRFLAPAFAGIGAGIESYDVITDDQLTAIGKARGVSAAIGGAAGAWGGAKLGMLAGSFAGPVGTVLGGIGGGALGYFGGKGGVNWLWGDNPERDFVQLTAPGGAKLGGLQGGGQTTLQIGEGVLRVDVNVQTDGSVSTQASMMQPMQLLRVEAGATDPGSFAAAAGSGF